jgi:hypothetical protein
LDRIYISFYPWQVAHITANTATTTSAARTRVKTGSDHTPVASVVSARSQKPKGERPIPKWVAYHPRYQQILQDLLNHHNHADYDSPYDAINQMFNPIFHKAAKLTLKEAFKTDPDSNDTKTQLIFQAARSVAYNLASLARFVKKDSSEVGNHLHIDDNGRVSLTNPSGFHKLAHSIVFQNLSSAEQSNNNNNNNTHNVTSHTPHEIPAPILPSKPKGGRHAQLARLLRLWNPFERKAISVSIQRPDGTLAESPDDKGKAIAAHWKPTFSPKPIDEDLARVFAKRYCVPLDLKNPTPPTIEDHSKYLK